MFQCVGMNPICKIWTRHASHELRWLLFFSTAYVYAVGDGASSFLMYDRFWLPLAHTLPLISPIILSFKNTRDAIAYTSCSFFRLPWSIGMKVVMSCNRVSSFVITSYFSNILRPRFKLYCVMIILMICISCSSNVIFLPCSAVWIWILPWC